MLSRPFTPNIPPISNVGKFAAPYLLGAIWNWCLYGVLVVQFYVYNYNFPQDSRSIKLLAYSIFILETAETAISGRNLYYWFAADFGNRGHLDASFYYYFDTDIMDCVVSVIVQLFFVYRILVLSKKRLWWLCIIICLVSAVGKLGEFTSSVDDLIPVYTSKNVVSDEVSNIVWLFGLAGNMLSDLLIAFAMLYHLRRIWVRDGKLSSHPFVSMVRLTVETNLVTTIVSIVALIMGILSILYPHDNFYMCPRSILGKLHSNTLLVYLNNRILIHESYEARGAVADSQVVTGGASPGITTEPIILEPENPQNNSIKPVAEAKADAEKRVDTPPTTADM